MGAFEDREKNFEKKFVHDEEMQFKVNARRNKYLGEWAADRIGKTDQSKLDYIQEVIKSDFIEPGDEDVFRKIKTDFENAKVEFKDNEIREQMKFFFDSAKKDFI